MSGALALVPPSEQAIPTEKQDCVLMEEESILNAKKEKSEKGSIKDDQDNQKIKEDEEEEEKGDSKEKQAKENEAKSQSNQNEGNGSQTNRGSHTTSTQVTQNEARGQSNQNEASGSQINGGPQTASAQVTYRLRSQSNQNVASGSGINRSSQTTSNQDAWRDLKLTFPSDKKHQGKAGNSKAVTFLKATGKFALKTAVISGAVIGGTTLLLPVLGFGPLGPIAGSLAAAYQSSVGTVAAGSIFSTLQSAGMVGLSAAAQGGIVAGSAVVSAATSKSKSKNDDGKK